MKPVSFTKSLVLKQNRAEAAVDWSFKRRSLLGIQMGGQKWHRKSLAFSLLVKTGPRSKALQWSLDKTRLAELTAVGVGVGVKSSPAAV